MVCQYYIGGSIDSSLLDSVSTGTNAVGERSGAALMKMVFRSFLIFSVVVFALQQSSAQEATFFVNGKSMRLAEFEKIRAERKVRLAEVIKHMPIDYRDCILPVLVDEISAIVARPHQKIYVSVLDQDIDDHLRKALARQGLRAKPLSAMAGTPSAAGVARPPKHTSTWDVSISYIDELPAGGYLVDAGFHCGSLCAASYRYTVAIEGEICFIKSKETVWQS